jgi:hypothetical protein
LSFRATLLGEGLRGVRCGPLGTREAREEEEEEEAAAAAAAAAAKVNRTWPKALGGSGVPDLLAPKV